MLITHENYFWYIRSVTTELVADVRSRLTQFIMAGYTYLASWQDISIQFTQKYYSGSYLHGFHKYTAGTICPSFTIHKHNNMAALISLTKTHNITGSSSASPYR